MSVPIWKIHDKFGSYWKEYKKSDIDKVCNSIIRLSGIKKKGDAVNQVRNHWSTICNFLINWEGKKNV